MIPYSALIQGLALENKNLTVTWIHVKHVHSTHLHLQIVTWSIYKKRREFGTYINSSKCPCNSTLLKMMI